MAKVTIYGKDTCPYTTNAREEYARRGYEVEYVNLHADGRRIPEMLQHSGGRRAVPVIVDEGKVVIGFGGT